MGRNRQSGFTLIEAMIVVAIIAIVSAIGVPSYRAMIRESRISSITEEMLISLMLAKTESTMQGKEIFVTPVSGTNWLGGWTVAASGGSNLRVVQAFQGIDSASGPDNFSFRPMLRAGADTAISFCSVGLKSRTVSVKPYGVVQNSIATSNSNSCP